MGKHNKVTKLTEKKIRCIIQAKIRNESTKSIAASMKLSESTVKRVWMHWINHKEPIPIKKPGRKKKETDAESEQLIIEVHEEQKLGARRLEKIIKFKYGIHIPHNRIHQVLIKNELANTNKNKKKRRKPWIRYERKHSLTAIHLDWHTCEINKKEVSVALDDSSRYILAGGEFDAATGENSISIVMDVLNNYGEIRKIEQVITDHGSQYYANKKDKHGSSESKFEAFLKEHGIRHIKAGIKHPQTNGKLEKWHDLYEKQRFKFDTFADFIKWYNTVRYHESLDTKHYLQTPENAFWARLPDGCKLNIFFKRMEENI